MSGEMSSGTEYVNLQYVPEDGMYGVAAMAVKESINTKKGEKEFDRMVEFKRELLTVGVNTRFGVSGTEYCLMMWREGEDFYDGYEVFSASSVTLIVDAYYDLVDKVKAEVESTISCVDDDTCSTDVQINGEDDVFAGGVDVPGYAVEVKVEIDRLANEIKPPDIECSKEAFPGIDLIENYKCESQLVDVLVKGDVNIRVSAVRTYDQLLDHIMKGIGVVDFKCWMSQVKTGKPVGSRLDLREQGISDGDVLRLHKSEVMLGGTPGKYGTGWCMVKREGIPIHDGTYGSLEHLSMEDFQEIIPLVFPSCDDYPTLNRYLAVAYNNHLEYGFTYFVDPRGKFHGPMTSSVLPLTEFEFAYYDSLVWVRVANKWFAFKYWTNVARAYQMTVPAISDVANSPG